jgi:hypothetical protein
MCLFPEYIRKLGISSHCLILPQIIFWNTFFNIHIIYYIRAKFLLIDILWNFTQPYEVRLSLYVRFLLPKTSVYTVETIIIIVSSCTRLTDVTIKMINVLKGSCIQHTNIYSNVAADIGEYIETLKKKRFNRSCIKVSTSSYSEKAYDPQPLWNPRTTLNRGWTMTVNICHKTMPIDPHLQENLDSAFIT